MESLQVGVHVAKQRLLASRDQAADMYEMLDCRFRLNMQYVSDGNLRIITFFEDKRCLLYLYTNVHLKDSQVQIVWTNCSNKGSGRSFISNSS
jgi:hypothetical protein